MPQDKAKSVASKEFSKSQGASQEASIQSISFVTLPFRFVFPSVPYVAPFVLTSAPFVTSSPSFHLIYLPLPFVSSRSFRYLLSFASTLLSCSSCPFLIFLSTRPFHCVRLFVATPSVTSFLSFLLFVIPFATSSLSFQLFPSVPYNIYVVPSVLTLPFPSLLPPHRFNASILFIHLFLSFQAVSFRYFLRLFQVLQPVRLPLPVFNPFISLLPSFFNSYIRFDRFVYVFLSF